MFGTINQDGHPLNGAKVELYKVWANGTHVVRLVKDEKGFSKGDILHLPAVAFVATDTKEKTK